MWVVEVKGKAGSPGCDGDGGRGIQLRSTMRGKLHLQAVGYE